MYVIKNIINSMFDNLKINISPEIYDIYDYEITAEFIMLNKMLLKFIVQIYGIYNLLLIGISLFFRGSIGIDCYIGIFEVIIALFFLYSFKHWSQFYKSNLNFFIGLSIFQFIIVTCAQYLYPKNIVGFLPVMFSIMISAVTIIKYNRVYNRILFTILCLDIIVGKLIYHESLIKLMILSVDNLFVFYCAIFINSYFTKMKINEIIQKTQLISQRDTDGLTGLMNRNAAEKYINEFLCSNKAGVIMVFDIDNFKKVNDNFGHVEGDLLLIDISRKIKSFFREGDCVARLGGDEFLIFIPNGINIECIENKAKSILQACYRNIGYGDNEVQISCSIGIVNIKDDYDYSFDNIYRLADEALYESKRNGKNRYTLWSNMKI